MRRDRSQAPPCPKCGGARGREERVEFRVQDRNGKWTTETGTEWTECGACRGTGQGG